ncbi:MAG: hypothetical protein E4H36_02480 [Spirochaetales bacterium]|nr:MAG: hypothetical protein E4H36_02480 [Spirochaetales bacterium]
MNARTSARRASALRWESLCRQCGVCCYEKRYTGIFSLYTDLSSPCRHLDTKTRHCKVYESRFRVCGDCRKMTIIHALFASYLPADCGYVQRYRGLFKKRRD